jgi:hypothetical protein
MHNIKCLVTRGNRKRYMKIIWGFPHIYIRYVSSSWWKPLGLWAAWWLLLKLSRTENIISLTIGSCDHLEDCPCLTIFSMTDYYKQVGRTYSTHCFSRVITWCLISGEDTRSTPYQSKLKLNHLGAYTISPRPFYHRGSWSQSIKYKILAVDNSTVVPF